MKKDELFLGVDPGKEGGAAAIDGEGEVVETIDFKKNTEREVAEFFELFRNQEVLVGRKKKPSICMLEKVHSMPKQGVKSMFTFGQNYGFVRGCLICFRIKFIEIAPKVWQTKLGCLSHGDKRVTRAKAQQLFPEPGRVITNSIADALLLAWSARQYME